MTRSSGSRSNNGGGAQSIPGVARKMVQSLKEIVNCPETEIYAMLKDYNMDPNETIVEKREDQGGLSSTLERERNRMEYGIKGFPTMKVFVPGKLPVDYQVAGEVKPIAEFALQQVVIVSLR
ncbi:PDI-like 2-3 [Actinidia rufa]|uniref:PDI-like 2-3 n=1 Tax=Actinidia rufa TaxID=165716 RepID=A0A7J0DWY0_9ERIC|nr:PDI-like 2-3 [Actinidia rufa]